MRKCVSCGNRTDSTEKYPYCARCDLERNSPSVRPLVWEYVGGKLGSLPNRRGDVEYTLVNMGYAFNSCVKGFRVYVRPDDNQPIGNIAVLLHDGIVIVNGKFELYCLLSEPNLLQSPVIDNLPCEIDTETPEHYERATALGAEGNED